MVFPIGIICWSPTLTVASRCSAFGFQKSNSFGVTRIPFPSPLLLRFLGRRVLAAFFIRVGSHLRLFLVRVSHVRCKHGLPESLCNTQSSALTLIGFISNVSHRNNNGRCCGFLFACANNITNARPGYGAFEFATHSCSFLYVLHISCAEVSFSFGNFNFTIYFW